MKQTCVYGCVQWRQGTTIANFPKVSRNDRTEASANFGENHLPVLVHFRFNPNFSITTAILFFALIMVV